MGNPHFKLSRLSTVMISGVNTAGFSYIRPTEELIAHAGQARTDNTMACICVDLAQIGVRGRR